MSIKLKTILLKNRIYIDIYQEYYYFTVPRYCMELKLYKKDILEFLRNPINNFVYKKSHGNCIDNDDRNIIVEYLIKKIGFKRYKTVSRCILYSKKDTLKYNLNLFSTDELYKYFDKYNN